jgi:hypothetical protein
MAVIPAVSRKSYCIVASKPRVASFRSLLGTTFFALLELGSAVNVNSELTDPSLHETLVDTFMN